MAMFKASVRWCKARLCTGFLFVVLCAVAWFAISAAYHNISGHGGPEEEDSKDVGLAGGRRLSAGGDYEYAAGDREDDGEVQICKYPLSVPDVGELVTWNRYTDSNTCSNPAHEALFYASQGYVMLYADALNGREMDRCEYRGIQWAGSDENFVYTEAYTRRESDSLDVGIGHDFVHVQCYLSRTSGSGSGTGNGSGIRQKQKQSRKRRDEATPVTRRPPGDQFKPRFQYRDAKAFHRSVVHRNSPRLVGSLGMPDFRDSLLPRENTPDSDIVVKKEASKDNRHLLSETDDREDAGGRDEFQREEINVENRGVNLVESNDNKWSTSFRPRRVDGRPDFDQFLVQVSERDDVRKRASSTLPRRNSLQMNVLVLALDSISQFSFRSNFPETRAFLNDELKAVTMNGYNSIGDAATAAVIPLITGSKETELLHRRRNGKFAQYVDNFPFIWYKYEQSGYVTLFAEDQPDLGTFETLYHGFEEMPADHYMRPFWLAALSSDLNADSQPNCLGSVPKYQFILDYVSDFFRKYQSIPKFAFGFLSDFNRTRYVDDDLKSFLRLMKKEGFLDNTVVIVVGDHGISYGDRRYTVAGKMEERLPQLSVAFPPAFREKYHHLMKNLRTNKDRLTTAFDLHETMLSLLDINVTQVPVKKSSRAVSLLQTVPKDRTCATADLDVHWCTCVKYEKVSDSLDPARSNAMLAKVALNEINEQLETKDKDKQCARLSLQSVDNVMIVVPNEIVLELSNKLDPDEWQIFNFSRQFQSPSDHYQVVFRTSPGGAHFEATVVAIAGGHEINGLISRIDEYGSRSKCIIKSHPDLRKYCQCLP